MSESAKEKTINDILAERETTHGNFSAQAELSDNIKFAMKSSGNWPYLNSEKREALDMIAHKISRILAGNSDHKDHWDDIAGYALLVSKELE